MTDCLGPAAGVDTDGAPAWSRETAVATTFALAATTRVKPLFPASLARLSGDRQWNNVAQLVRRHVSDVVQDGEYPFEDFYENREPAVQHVADQAVRTVLERRSSSASVAAELVAYRLRPTRADLAGRRLARPTADFDVVALAARHRMAPIGKQEDDLLAFSDLEIAYYLTWRPDGELVVEMTSRGGPRRALGEFESEPEAFAALVRLLGR
jgi:hypothetical protein